jgi:Plavaka transposase
VEHDVAMERNDAMTVDEVISDVQLSLAERRSRRKNRRLPARFRDEVPKPQAALLPTINSEPFSESRLQLPSSVVTSSHQSVAKVLKSPLNAFGLFRQYKAENFPCHDPESEVDATDLSDVLSDHREDNSASLSFLPYPNENAFLLGEWFWDDCVQKSQASFKKLIDIIGRPEFRPEDVRDVRWNHIHKELGDSLQSQGWSDEPDARWNETSITISVPFHRKTDNPGVKDYTLSLRHRSIVGILKEKMSNVDDFRHFHFQPFELRWQKGSAPELPSTRVYGELYTSPAFLDAHDEIQALPGEPGCSLQRVVVSLMFSSDATQLTSFGNSSLWPCYLYFGNESKYRRYKPSNKLCNHVAYFQKVSDNIQITLVINVELSIKLPPEFKDFVSLHAGVKGPNQALLTHCQRELLHAQWKALLDDDFLAAYEHGVVIECCDGIKRRFYLRIFTYAADYPEK